MNIRFIDDEIEKFFRSLEKPTIAKVLRTLDLLEHFGNRLGLPHSRSLGGGLFELRVRGAQEVRLLYVFHRRGAVVLLGFIKKSNSIPRRILNAVCIKRRDLDRI